MGVVCESVVCVCVCVCCSELCRSCLSVLSAARGIHSMLMLLRSLVCYLGEGITKVDTGCKRKNEFQEPPGRTVNK
jgi:hypothetical protein